MPRDVILDFSKVSKVYPNGIVLLLNVVSHYRALGIPFHVVDPSGKRGQGNGVRLQLADKTNLPSLKPDPRSTRHRPQNTRPPHPYPNPADPSDSPKNR
jgi:hypothetical protein